MPRFLKNERDPEGKAVRVDAGIRGTDGKVYLVLERQPPLYAAAPAFVVELTGERIDIRGDVPRTYHKAYAIQEFTPGEIKFLKGLSQGKEALPFFNFSYPHIIKRMGKNLYCLTDEEISKLVEGERYWKLIGGKR